MKTELDWSNYHDQGMGDAYADIPKNGGNYAKAISVCIRSNRCQLHDNRGVMCPSFRITNDEALSPGGRVALLKALLNQNDYSFLHDPQLEDTLNSCVSCKGCKRECENNIDMAAIKAEYLAQQKQSGKKSLRSWLFGHFPDLLLQYPQLAYLIRLRNKSSIVRMLSRFVLKMNSHIELPEPACKPFSSSLTNAYPAEEVEKNVVLLVDNFTAIFHPHIAHSTEVLLNAAGYQVTTIAPTDTNSGRPLDTGRSLFSQGYISEARKHAIELVETLWPYVEKGHRIIGLEPSAALMIRDEFLMMGLGEKAQQLANATLLLEEFIARETKAGRFTLSFKPWEKKHNVLVHGHCHQKAVGAMKSMRKALRLIPDLPFEFIEASCCGMAGSFGLEAEHAKESRDMAQLGLLPALDADSTATVVCNGFSCGHQILALTGRKPLHIATLLYDMLETAN
ncbi:(Fe-S)-binding protein [Vibrio sp.]|nr:(Fe-S)-binding protein [Vibrio sp.]